MTVAELNNIVQVGENDFVEFKISFSKAVAISLVAFSNNKGGKVLVGVSDKGNIVGVSVAEESIQKWINEIKQNTSPHVIADVEAVSIKVSW